MAEEQAHLEAGHHDGGTEEVEGVPPQIVATPGMPERKAVARRQARVRENLHLLPKDAPEAILRQLDAEDGANSGRDNGDRPRHRDDETDTASIPTQRSGTEARPWTLRSYVLCRPAVPGLAAPATVTEGVVPQSSRVTS